MLKNKQCDIIGFRSYMRIMLGLVLYGFKTKDKGERIMRFKHCPTCGQELIEREIGCEGKLPYCDGCKKPWLEMFSACIISVVVNEFDEVALLKQSNDVIDMKILKVRDSGEQDACLKLDSKSLLMSEK